MEHALRFGPGENLFHRGYSDGLGFSSQQQCETNFQVRLVLVGEMEGRHSSDFSCNISRYVLIWAPSTNY